MASLFGRFLFTTLTIVALTQFASGAVVFRSGEKGKFVGPGEEEVSGNAEQLFEIAQDAEKKGNLHRAASAYRSLFHKHPKDALAPGAAYRYAELIEQMHSYLPAADAYRTVVERYPNSPHFNDAMEGQFRIGEMYLNGQKIKLLGISIANSLDHAVDIFAAIIRTAPYGKYTARAQFDIGRAREKEGAQLAAVQAYQAVVEKFPNSPVAADAQYQVGYIWMVAAQGGTKDSAAAGNARLAFQDFLFRYPNSEKAAQARADLATLEHKQTNSSLDIAKATSRDDKQSAIYRAAVIYYNEVIRQQPGSAESEHARKRLEELKKKVGDKALQPAYAAAEAEAAKKKAAEKPAGDGQPAPSGAANDAAPLPPPTPTDSNSSLPPPSSLMPDNTAPPPSGTSDIGGGASTSSTPEPGATPESSAAPTP